MKIEIKSFNCIRHLEYEIEDDKINYLIGNSGSGKSSIAKAISNKEYDSYIPYFNNNLTPEVKINGTIDFDIKSSLFDDDYMRNILISKSQSNEIYSILIDDEKHLQSIEKEYENSISSLNNIKNKLYEIKRNIEILASDLKIDYLKNDNNSYKSTCVIQKMMNNIESNQNSYVKYKKYDSKRIKWFSDGTSYEEYANNKCPFCNKKMSKSKLAAIDKIIVFDAKTYEKINSKNNIFTALNIEQPNWVNKSQVKKFNKKLKDYFDIKNEINEAIQYIDAAKNADLVFSQKIEKLKISTTLKRLYPDISEAFTEFNNQYVTIRKSLGTVKSESNKLINKNIKKINDHLYYLGINYKFKKVSINEDSKSADYIIVHKNDTNNSKDRVEGLSYGERNLIGMVLFLCAHGKDEIVIIDDPASSFDEYRRKVIFDMFYEFKGDKTTMLVISHDPLFAKFALVHDKGNKQDSFAKNTGHICLLENYDKEEIKTVTKDDFDSLAEFIKKRVLELNPTKMTYQLAANLRLFYEREKKHKYHKDIYGYLSMIIHRIPKTKINDTLNKIDRKETELLDEISKTFEFQNAIDVLDDDYCNQIEYSKMKDLEKIVYARETCTGKGSKRIKDELSNIIHLNNSYLICLNPYKYNYYSNFTYHYINNIN